MAKVVSVVDGSTFRLQYRGAEHDARLMGVATPPTGDDTKPILKRLGSEAVTFLREMTNSGWVYVEFPAGEEPREKNGPVDVAVYGGRDSVLLNEKLVIEGFGIVNRKIPTPLNNQLLKAEAKAKESRRGIWGSFEFGDGKAVANGRSGTYIGTVAPQGAPGYVTFWIISYY